ncbi:MAG: serine/threonine-protein phosphatase [Lachnospiraceae bacterium]|nr:serine/threonine-protein phosphatase [Lachnospiraceae bacterium]
MKYIGGYATNIGNVRKVNQDAVVLKKNIHDGVGFAVLAVCDGIGGLEHGEITSNIVKSGIVEWYENVLEWLDVEAAEPETIFSHLKDAADEWNRRVVDFAMDMRTATGTTMSLLMCIRDKYFTLQVGDSRIYRLDGAKLVQLTTDDSVEKYRGGKLRSYLDNFVGKSYELSFATGTGTLKNSDLFLVCSDGFYHHLKEEDLERLNTADSDEEIRSECETLIFEMMERGERDNISVGVLRLTD